MSDQDRVIEARGICNRFGRQVVHENLDLDLYRGEILAVVGGSGSGKSVLLRSIIGLRRPNEGQIKVVGQDLAGLHEEQRSLVERRFGVLFQKGALFSSLTVTENVALPLIEHAGLSRADAERLAGVKLALAGLPISAADKYPASLSGGMIKRAALARALALDPDILFLDEPTAGLDPIGAAAFDQLILTLRDALGLSVFLSADPESARLLLREKRRFRAQERRLAHAHVSRLQRKVVQSIETSSLHLELIADMKRLNSLFCSSAYVVLGGSDTGGLMLDSVPDEARQP